MSHRPEGSAESPPTPPSVEEVQKRGFEAYTEVERLRQTLESMSLEDLELLGGMGFAHEQDVTDRTKQSPASDDSDPVIRGKVDFYDAVESTLLDRYTKDAYPAASEEMSEHARYTPNSPLAVALAQTRAESMAKARLAALKEAALNGS